MASRGRKKREKTTRRGCAKGELSHLFPTMLLSRRMPGAEAKNARLREIVLEREKTDPGLARSTRGGWHSSADLWDWPEPEIRSLCDWVVRAAEDYTASVAPVRHDDVIKVSPYGGAWVNLLRDGGYNKVHNHPGAVWSAVYYVSVGELDPEPGGNGDFEFMDPRPGNIHGSKKIIKPEAGLLIMFPSWLHHYVNPYRGGGERISIAFNMKIDILRG